MASHFLEPVFCLANAPAVMPTTTTRFEILPSPDSISGAWYSASGATLSAMPLEQSARANHDPVPPHFQWTPAPISSFEETYFEPCSSSHHQNYLKSA